MTDVNVRGALPLLPGVEATAAMSSCGAYRYVLTRDWASTDAGHVLWIMLNPSSAAADVDDRTVRKCQTFSRAWGYDGILVANLFGLRATSPDELYRHPDPVGPANDEVIAGLLAAPEVRLVVAAWGVHGRLNDRSTRVLVMASQAGRDLHALTVTKDGHPGHPLYLPDATQPFVWIPSEEPR